MPAMAGLFLSLHYGTLSFINIILVSFGSKKRAPQNPVVFSTPCLNSGNLYYNTDLVF